MNKPFVDKQQPKSIHAIKNTIKARNPLDISPEALAKSFRIKLLKCDLITSAIGPNPAEDVPTVIAKTNSPAERDAALELAVQDMPSPDRGKRLPLTELILCASEESQKNMVRNALDSNDVEKAKLIIFVAKEPNKVNEAAINHILEIGKPEMLETLILHQRILVLNKTNTPRDLELEYGGEPIIGDVSGNPNDGLQAKLMLPRRPQPIVRPSNTSTEIIHGTQIGPSIDNILFADHLDKSDPQPGITRMETLLQLHARLGLEFTEEGKEEINEAITAPSNQHLKTHHTINSCYDVNDDVCRL